MAVRHAVKLVITILSIIVLVFACPPLPELHSELAVRNVTHGELHARWFRQTSNNRDYKFWSSRSFIWCFGPIPPSASDQTALATAITQAWALWTGADTQGKLRSWNFRQGTTQECQQTSGYDRMTFVVNREKDLQTKRIRNALIDIDIAIADQHPLGINAAIAHEMGHAFGLQHEHQREDVWGSPLGTKPNPRVRFQCSALLDWPLFGNPKDDAALCKKNSPLPI